jgi:hypothetical protein
MRRHSLGGGGLLREGGKWPRDRSLAGITDASGMRKYRTIISSQHPA